MQKQRAAPRLISWILGTVIFVIGSLNLVLVHVVPGLVFLSISLLYLPQANTIFKSRLGFQIPLALKLVLGAAIIWFTLGVSDLGDMID